jgi:iron complex outermembrane recepter protein
MNKNRLVKAVELSLATAIVASAAGAAELEEVLVTAQKRVESVQDIPFTVNTVSGATIQQNGILDLLDLQSVMPSLFMPSTGSPGQGASFRLRGFGSPPFQLGIEPAVALFIDDIYRSRSGVAMAEMVDVNRIEVLKGPQGTLFGKNTTAGVIHIVSNAPSTEAVEGFIEGSYENYSRKRIKGALNLPLGESAALRVSGMWGEGDGFLENQGVAKDSHDLDRSTINAQLLFAPSDDLSINLAVSATSIDEICCSPVPTEEIDDLVYYDTFGPQNQADDLVYSARVQWALSDTLSLTSITAYQDYQLEESIDGDFILPPFLTIDSEVDISMFTQELRLTSTGDKLSWTVGAFYGDEEIDRLRAFIWGPAIEFTPLGGFLDPGLGVADDLFQKGTSWSVFGQADVALSDSMTLIAGVRYINEEKDGGGDFDQPQLGPPGVVNPSFRANIDESEPAGMLSLQYRPSDTITTYATYQHGYKAGGINLAREAAGEFGQPGEPTFENETADNFEVGVKTDLMDGAMRLDLAAFYTKYDDVQNQILVGQSFIVRNAAGATVTGAEMDMRYAITDSLQVNAALTVLNTEYENGTDLGTGDIGGEDLPWAPSFAGSIGWNYDRQLGSLDYYWSGNWVYKGDHVVNSAGNPDQTQESYNLLNTAMGIRIANWDASVWCRNCTDEIVNELKFSNPLLGSPLSYINRPLQYGVTLRYSF